MVAAGFTNKEISKQAFISEKAVEQRICRLANVLGITFSSGQNLRVKLTSHFVNWTNGRIEVKSK
jgi:DNA-binding NarL/FixJ family response regulator